MEGNAPVFNPSQVKFALRHVSTSPYVTTRAFHKGIYPF